MNAPHPKRAEILDRLRAGEDAKALAQEFGVKPNAMRGYVMRARRLDTPAPVVVDDAIPPTSGGKKKTKTALTEETAQRLCAMGFGIYAALTSEPLWQLNADQAKLLGRPLADSLDQLLPDPVAVAINAYSAPIEFFGNLSGIITAKNRAIEVKKTGARAPLAPEGATFIPNAPPSPPASPAPPFAQNADLAAAMAAAKGGLQDEDEPPAGEHLFTV